MRVNAIESNKEKSTEGMERNLCTLPECRSAGGAKKVLGVLISEHTGKAPGVPRKYTECTGEAVSCDYEL